jgi:predicted RecA/RadA family phage recombinase
MKAEYVQRGEILDYTNQTGKTIEAGEVVVFGNRIAVAGTTILEGEIGTLHMTGVYRVPKKASEAIEAGADVYYTDAGFCNGSSYSRTGKSRRSGGCRKSSCT